MSDDQVKESELQRRSSKDFAKMLDKGEVEDQLATEEHEAKPDQSEEPKQDEQAKVSPDD